MACSCNFPYVYNGMSYYQDYKGEVIPGDCYLYADINAEAATRISYGPDIPWSYGWRVAK